MRQISTKQTHCVYEAKILFCTYFGAAIIAFPPLRGQESLKFELCHLLQAPSHGISRPQITLKRLSDWGQLATTSSSTDGGYAVTFKPDPDARTGNMEAAVAEVPAQRKEGFKTKSRATASKRGVLVSSQAHRAKVCRGETLRDGFSTT